MTVCQTCGDKGYTALLIHCEKCEIVAVHRYCIDGPTNIDDDEVSWFCEDCVPRISQPVPAIRKSERVSSIVDRELQRKKARRNWRNLSSAKVEKSNCVGKSANQVVNDLSNLDEKKNGVVKKKQGNSKANGIDLKNGDSEPALQIRQKPITRQKPNTKQKSNTRQKPNTRQKKKALNSKDGTNKISLEPSLLTGQKTEDLKNSCIDDEDIQKKLEMNLDPQLSNEPEHFLEGTSKANERSDGESAGEKWHEHQHSFSELDSSLLDEQHGIEASEVTKQADGLEEKVSDNIDPKHVVSSSKKKRRVVIEKEYSDSEEEPSYVRDEHAQVVPDVGYGFRHSSSSQLVVKKSESGLAQEAFINSDVHFPTQPAPIHSDNHILPQTSMDFKNNTPQLLPAIVDCISAQPIISAIWRGRCSISNHVRPMSFGLEAHLSNKAHPKVDGAASALPNVLSFDIMKKHYAWPKRFEESPPMGDAIGLYFFPVDERDEKWYTRLLDEMIEGDLALKSHINNLELLVFCSRELPLEEWRFQSKYYLWGVFKQKQETPSTSQPSDVQISNPIRDLALPGTNRSSVSPSKIGNNSVMNPSNSSLHHQVGSHVELTPSSILKNPKPAYKEQGCNSHPASSDTDSLARTNVHRNSRNSSCKPQEHALGTGDVASLHRGRGSNLYKRNREIVKAKPIKKWKDAPLRQSSHSHSSYRSAMC